jgi:hypothetical protein
MDKWPIAEKQQGKMKEKNVKPLVFKACIIRKGSGMKFREEGFYCL